MAPDVIEERDTKFGKVLVLRDPLGDLLRLQAWNQITPEEADRRYRQIAEERMNRTLSGRIVNAIHRLTGWSG